MAKLQMIAPVLGVAALVLASAAGADTPDRKTSDGGPGWRTYLDPEHGTAVQYPAGVFSVSAGAPERGSGEEFRTPDGRARLVIYTLPNEERRSPEAYLKRHLLLAPGALQYTRVTRRFFAISGVRDGDVFYSRCNFPQGQRGDMGCIFLQYPQRETKAWDSIVTRISLSLRDESSAPGMASTERGGRGRSARGR